MSDPTVEFTVHANVAVLTINRQEARNAVNGDVAREMEAAIDRLEADDHLWPELWLGLVRSFAPGPI